MIDVVTQWFVIPPSSVILSGYYHVWLVVLSVFMATFFSFVGLQVLSYKSPTFSHWLNHLITSSAALALGGGVWCMHFLGMLAFHLHIDVSYNVTLTILSMIPCVLASWVALNFIESGRDNKIALIGSGVLVGAGIGVMHYLGMAAMEMALLLRYDLGVFLASIVFAVVFATLSLWGRFYLGKKLSQKLILINFYAALGMGLAISGMHYLGMAAARFVLPDGVVLTDSEEHFSYVLAFGVTIVTIVVIGLILGITTVKRYKAISERVQASEERLLTIMDSAVDGIITINEKGTVASINQATTRLLGWLPEDLIGSNVSKIVPGADGEHHDGYIARYLATHKAKIIGIGRDVEALHKNGELIAIRLSIGHAKLANENYFVAFISDIRKRIEMERSIKANEAKFRTLVANIPGAAYRRSVRNNDEMLYVSDAVHHITGYVPSSFVEAKNGVTIHSLIIAEDQENIEREIEPDRNGIYTVEYRIRRADGKVRWVVDHYKYIQNENGEDCIDGFVMDITERVLARKEIDRFKALVDFSEDAIISIDLEGKVLSWNDAAQHIYGYKADEIIGQPMSLISSLTQVEELEFVSSVAEGKRKHHYRAKYHHKNGSSLYVSISASPIYDSDGVVRSISKISRDVTHEVIEAENIKKQLEHDHLTGLLSRFGFHAYFEKQVEQARIRNDSLAVMFIDLDGFKQYNDTYGHDFGDHLLETVGSVINIALSKSDAAGRLGGDEFVVCMVDIADHQRILQKATNIISNIANISSVDGVDVSLTGSLGVALYPKDAQEVEELLRLADAAMYRAKNQGKNQVVFYEQEKA
ncbi:PAS domain S-box protein [Marinomonas ostreistagni]|uniref:PAS domain S-box protein n=1 Tax=Marinomonas ostreistagni TaxID=359209 RepID=UPI00194E1E72|nr:PAS domain S-box protein [Marinomonas ostreistagni]MBM6550011.1 PAS domain S-box protein [Marinomonas ostreistagni]